MKMTRTMITVAMAAAACLANLSAAHEGHDHAGMAGVVHAASMALDATVPLFVGTFTEKVDWLQGYGEGIHYFKFDTQSGNLTQVGKATKFGPNPTFITSTEGKGRRVIYATSEVDPGKVFAISVDDAGVMTKLNEVDSGGAGSTHVSVSPNQEFLTVSNYAGGSVRMFPINADGSLKEFTFKREYPAGEASKVKIPQQEASHMHSMTWVPNKMAVLGCDLGSDRIVQFTLDAAKQNLTEAGVIKRPPGSGPRHMALHPTKNFAYVLDELSNTIGVYGIEANGLLKPAPIQEQITTLPTTGAGDGWTAADIHVSSNGLFLYSSNRHDVNNGTIAIFGVDAKTGVLTPIGHESTKGQIPRSFSLYGNFLLVANQKTDNIEVFEVDSKTGLLKHAPARSTKVSTPLRLFFPRW